MAGLAWTCEQEAGGERAQKEVLEARLVRGGVGAVEAGQHVQTDGQKLKAEEDDHHVGPGCHQHHADGGKEYQGVELALVALLLDHVAVRDEDGETRGDQEDHLEEDREVILHYRSVER